MPRDPVYPTSATHPAIWRCMSKFHFMLYELADQPQTLHFVRVLWAKYPFDKLTAMPNRLSDVAAEHEAILAAARAGDTRAALKAMQYHIENGWREFKRNYPLYDQASMP